MAPAPPFLSRGHGTRRSALRPSLLSTPPTPFAALRLIGVMRTFRARDLSSLLEPDTVGPAHSASPRALSLLRKNVT